MMRDADKPFICHRRGWSFNIRPRSLYGWWLIALWAAPLIGGAALHGWLVQRWPDPAVALSISLTLALLGIGWLIAMVRWMLARSVILDKD